MDCGLGNLFDLKRELLLASDAAGDDYDLAVQELGKGVASAFESYCDRRFARAVGDTLQFDASKSYLVVPRYPLESVSLVEVRSTVADGFATQAGQPENFRRESGIVIFGGMLGSEYETGRITYTGGYVIETLEPTDGSYPTTVPTGAEALPAALKLAWLKQCKYYWDRRSIEDRAKAGFTTEESARFQPVGDDLLATVRRTLDGFRRFSA